MTAIINGKIVYNEMAENARGGTELMAQRMIDNCDSDLLKQFNIIHSRIREDHLREDGNNILVLHDLPEDPESSKLSDPEYRKNFKAIVCVSNWQKEQYHNVLGIPYTEMYVIQNGIEPFGEGIFEKKLEKFKEDKTLRFIYHTTPHRGLNLLTSAFTNIRDYINSEEFKGDLKVHLDVFSSFSIYGWDNRDEPYEPLFDILRNDPDITYHGAVPNKEVREALEKSHIFAYPNIWKETSCLAGIEALCSENIVVHPWFGALGETCGTAGSFYYEYSDNIEEHAARMFHVLKPLIDFIGQDSSMLSTIISKQRKIQLDTNNKYDIKTVANIWNILFSEILKNK